MDDWNRLSSVRDRWGQTYALVGYEGPQQYQLLLRDGRRNIGHANLLWQGAPILTLVDLFVTQPYRRRGLGAALLAEVRRVAAEHALRSVQGSVLRCEAEAAPYLLAWLARQGFGVLPQPADRMVAAVITLIVPRPDPVLRGI